MRRLQTLFFVHILFFIFIYFSVSAATADTARLPACPRDTPLGLMLAVGVR